MSAGVPMKKGEDPRRHTMTPEEVARGRERAAESAPRRRRLANAFRKLAEENLDKYMQQVHEILATAARHPKEAYKYLELLAAYDSGKPVETVEIRPRQPMKPIGGDQPAEETTPLAIPPPPMEAHERHGTA